MGGAWLTIMSTSMVWAPGDEIPQPSALWRKRGMQAGAGSGISETLWADCVTHSSILSTEFEQWCYRQCTGPKKSSCVVTDCYRLQWASNYLNGVSASVNVTLSLHWDARRGWWEAARPFPLNKQSEVDRAFQIWGWNLFLTNWIRMLELLTILSKIQVMSKFVKCPHARPALWVGSHLLVPCLWYSLPFTHLHVKRHLWVDVCKMHLRVCLTRQHLAEPQAFPPLPCR